MVNRPLGGNVFTLSCDKLVLNYLAPFWFAYLFEKPIHLVCGLVFQFSLIPNLVASIVSTFDEWGAIFDAITHSSNA